MEDHHSMFLLDDDETVRGRQKVIWDVVVGFSGKVVNGL